MYQDLLPHVPNFPGLQKVGNTDGAQGMIADIPDVGAAIIPMIDGSPEMSMQRYNETGAHMGIFNNNQSAMEYGSSLGYIKPQPAAGFGQGPQMVPAPDFSSIGQKSPVAPAAPQEPKEKEDPQNAAKAAALAEAMKQRAAEREAGMQQVAAIEAAQAKEAAAGGGAAGGEGGSSGDVTGGEA